MGVLIYFMTVLPAYGISHCNWNSVTLNTEDPPNSGIIRHYHCLTLDASGTITVQGRHPLLVYVEGDVDISATINLDGDDGPNGVGIGTLAGGSAGPGGFVGGGVDNFYNTNGGNGRDGGNGGGGLGGTYGTAPATADAGGGGGSGGRFGVGAALQGASGTSGSMGSGIILGIGGIAPGPNSLTEDSFQDRFFGGTGGGAGGSGESYGNAASGGAGGGGGGAIRLYSKGSILLTGTIPAEGGNGGNGAWNGTDGPGGGGGGGSGGAIYFASTEDIIIDGGSLLTRGGSRGNGGNSGSSPAGGNGGGGSMGRIRLDDRDGRITYVGVVTITPSPRVFRFHIVRESDISLGCGSIGKSNPPWNGPLSFLIGLTLIILAMGLLKKLPQYRPK